MANEATATLKILAEVKTAVANLAKLTQEVERLSNEASKNKLDKLSKDSKKAEDKMASLTGRLGLVTAAFKKLKTAAATFGGALVLGLVIKGVAKLGRALVDLADDAVDTKISFDQIDLTLKAVTGSSEKAQATFDLIANTAKDLGFDLNETAKEFSLLAAAAQKTSLEGEGINKIFVQTTQVAKVMGLTQKELSNIFKAFRDILSKNVVSMEELRRQLGNSLPRAMVFAADALGVTQAEMVKMVETGQVLAGDLLPKMGDEFERFAASGVQEAMQQLQVAMNSLKVESQLLQDAFGDKLEPGLKRMAEGLAKVAGEAEPLAETLGALLSDLLEQLAKIPENLEFEIELLGILTESWRQLFTVQAEGVEKVTADQQQRRDFLLEFAKNVITTFGSMIGKSIEFSETQTEGWRDVTEVVEEETAKQVDIQKKGLQDLDAVLAEFARTREANIRRQIDAVKRGVEEEVAAIEGGVDEVTEARQRLSDLNAELIRAESEARQRALDEEVAAFNDHFATLISDAEVASGLRLEVEEETTEGITAELERRVALLEESATKQERIEESLQRKIQKLHDDTEKKREKLIEAFLKRKEKSGVDIVELEKKLQEDLVELFEQEAEKRDKLYKDAADSHKRAAEAIAEQAKKLADKQIAEAERVAKKEREINKKRREAARELADDLRALLAGGGSASIGDTKGLSAAKSDLQSLKGELADLESKILRTPEELNRAFDLKDLIAKAETDLKGLQSAATSSAAGIAAAGDDLVAFSQKAGSAFQGFFGSDGFIESFKRLGEGGQAAVLRIAEEVDYLSSNFRLTEDDVRRFASELNNAMGSAVVDVEALVSPTKQSSDVLRDLKDAAADAGVDLDTLAGKAGAVKGEVEPLKEGLGETKQSLSEIKELTPGVSEVLTGLGDALSTLSFSIAGEEGLPAQIKVLVENLQVAEGPVSSIRESVGEIQSSVISLTESFPVFAETFLVFAEAVQNEVEAGNLVALAETLTDIQSTVEQVGDGFAKIGDAVTALSADGPESVAVLKDIKDAFEQIATPHIVEGLSTAAEKIEDIVRAIIRGKDETAAFTENVDALNKAILDLADQMTTFVDFMKDVFLDVLESAVNRLDEMKAALEDSGEALRIINEELIRLKDEGVPAINDASAALDTLIEKLEVAQQKAERLSSALASVSLSTTI